MRHRALRTTTIAAAAALALAACADDTPDQDPAEDPAASEELGDLDDLDEDALEDLLGGEGEDPFADMPDPNEQVSDGAFRGEGIVLPVPSGWSLDQMSFAQGLVVALPEDATQQFFAQAVDTDTLPDPLTFEEVVESNREALGDDATVDEEVEVDGAAQAQQLRYEDVPAQAEGQPDSSVLLIVADDGDGRLAIFNYAAASEDFDEDSAELLLAGVGFDPDSDPAPPAPAPAP